MKLLRYLANLGYGSRREVAAMFGDGRVADARGATLYADDGLGDALTHADVRIDGATLDPAPGAVLRLHKPVGFTCSTRDRGRVVYDLLPSRFRLRQPVIAPVGRLDRDTSGLLLLTDDGALLHRITSPRTHLPKIYEATLAQDLHGDEAALFAGGTLLLDGETTPLRPAQMDVLGARAARLTLTEGRYHQVRRMFAACGNRVVTLHRSRVGGLGLGDLEAGCWRVLAVDETVRLFDWP
ncbi:MAG: pseudouridine synthase [Proteobacteria bacterium]|nr:pseudouridine synthase [Pseudomonadota bacterium]